MSEQTDIRKRRAENIKSSIELGVSFSTKTCKDYGVEWQKCLEALLDLGIRRFRLMSYWDLHEAIEDTVDFSQLDEQIKIIEKAGAKVTLCVGMRQPRWPESHIPKWALQLPESTRIEKYLLYHQAVVERYRNDDYVESWQLENEFWNKSFGQNNTFSRRRLVTEFKMIRELDPERPIIMSLGNTVGYPLFAPRPDLYGTTMYLTQYENGSYSSTRYSPLYFRIRRALIRLISRRDLLIHELQAEPWGPKANWEMNDTEQSMSMNPDQLNKCLTFARKSGIKYMDLWGGEWWYWRKTAKQDADLWSAVKNEVVESRHYT